MTITVHDVAAFMLARPEVRHLSMSALHKTAYYAQGWHLAWQGSPLFDEEIRTRASGPFVPALFPFQTDGYTETSWPAGNAAAVTGTTQSVLEAVFNSYGCLTGLTLGRMANEQAPCMLAAARATEEDPDPVISLDELKAFFKALNDAPESQVDYANRFMKKYTDEALRVRP